MPWTHVNSYKMPSLRRLLVVVQERFDQFCRLCCLHGLSYLRSDSTLPTAERVFWVTVFVINLILGALTIHNFWLEWINAPFMIVYDSALSFIWEVPFPSVVVCSYIGVKRSVVDLATSNETAKLYYSSLICNNKNFFKSKGLSVTQEEMDKFYEFLAQASPTCENLLRSCSWRGKEIPCCELFSPVITDIGRCYVFNSLPSHLLYQEDTIKRFMFNDSYQRGSRFWTPNVRYPALNRRNESQMFPRWSTQEGSDSGLIVELRQNMDEWQEPCSGGYQGFKVVVRSPAESPISTVQALKVPMKRDFEIRLTPVTLRTSHDYHLYDYKLRGCVFLNERKLQNFKIYTLENCVHQCVIDLSLEMCDCVGYYMPS